MSNIITIEDGSIQDSLPKHMRSDYIKCIRANKMNPFPKNTRVCAVVYLMKRGVVVKKFYGTNRPVTPNEIRELFRYYPKNTIMAHAEYSALNDALKWISWKGYSIDDFDIQMLVVRNGGNVPARPCKYCRRYIKEKLGEQKTMVVYPVNANSYSIEVI